jgi:hypothetical protein
MKPSLITIGIMIVCLAVSSTAYSDGGNGDRGGLKFNSNLSGAQEVVFENGNFVPGGTDTNAEARIKAKFDKELTKVEVNLRIKDLEGNFTRAHFHCGRAGQNGPIAFGLVDPGPLVFDGQRIEGALTNLDFTGVDCIPVVGRPVNNIAALAFAMRDGLIYINVHSDLFPLGETRGQMLGNRAP